MPRLFLAMEVVVDQERFLIQATRLPWFKRTKEELEISAAAAEEGGAAQQTKVGYESARETMLYRYHTMTDFGRVGEDTFKMYLRYRYRYTRGCIFCIFQILRYRYH